MVNCAVSGKNATCDIKKGKYISVMVSDPANPSKKLWVKEEGVMQQIAKVIQSIAIPEKYMPEILAYIRQNHEAEKSFHHERTKSMQLEMNDIEGKMNRMADLLIEGHLTGETYQKKKLELELRRKNLLTDIIDTSNGNSEFKTALYGVYALITKSPQIFKGSNITEKRTLIGLVFSNLSLEGSTLRYSLRKPLGMFAGLSDCQEWCREKTHG
jgi:hypothetical protein